MRAETHVPSAIVRSALWTLPVRSGSVSRWI